MKSVLLTLALSVAAGVAALGSQGQVVTVERPMSSVAPNYRAVLSVASTALDDFDPWPSRQRPIAAHASNGGANRRGIEQLADGSYRLAYTHPYVVGSFAPEILQRMQGVDDAEVAMLWDKAFARAVPKYLKARRAVPAECVFGVVVISHVESDGGQGQARFRCRSEPEQGG